MEEKTESKQHDSNRNKEKKDLGLKNRDFSNIEAFFKSLPYDPSQETHSVPLAYYSHVNEVKRNPFSLRAVDSFTGISTSTSTTLPIEKHSLPANLDPPPSILASFPIPTPIDQSVEISLPAKWQYNPDDRKIGMMGLFFVWYSIEGKESLRAFFWLFFQFFWFALGWYMASDSDKYNTAILIFGVDSFRVARGAAKALNVNTCLLLLTMCRLSISWIQSTLFKSHYSLLSSSRSLHIGLGISVILWAIVHTAAHIANIAHAVNLYQSSILWKIAFKSPAWITGILMLIVLAGISISSLPIVRAKSYEVFYYTHVLIFIYLGLLSIHGAFCFIPVDRDSRCNIPTSYIYILPPLILYIIELLISRYQSTRPTCISKVILHPSQVLELQIVKPSLTGHFLAGQYIYLKVPSLSLLQWHPFTLTSAPQEEHVSLHIRLIGNWCKSLALLFGISRGPSLDPILTSSYGLATSKVNNMSITSAASTPSATSASIEKDKFSNILLQVPPRILVSGPYGSSAEAIFGYPIAICIGAGIGQTPFASILKYILLSSGTSSSTVSRSFGSAVASANTTSACPVENSTHQNLKHYPTPPRKVFFIGISRLPQAFEWFHQILRDIEKNDVEERISVQLYLTGKLPDYQVSNILLHDREGQCDAITGLRTPTNYGRPKISSILRDISDKAKRFMRDNPLSLSSDQSNNGSHSNLRETCSSKLSSLSLFSRNRSPQENPIPIGVFFCGPPKLGRTIHTACAFLNHQHQQSSAEISMDESMKPKQIPLSCRFHFHQETF